MDNFNDESGVRDFNFYLQKAKEAREKMTLGYEAIKSEHGGFKERLKNRIENFGFKDYDPSSIYSPNEQRSMSFNDRMSHRLTRALELGTGVGQVGIGFLPTIGKISKMATWGSIAAGVMGAGGLSTGLGAAALYSNPYALTGTAALKTLTWSLQESLMTPMANKRMFQSSALLESRDKIGGMGSETGVGGLSIAQSLKIGKVAESMRFQNRDISADTFNEFIKGAANLPQMQYLNSEKAVENMGKYLKIMTGLAKQFKGREGELISAIQQFSQMGMTLDQAQTSVLRTSRAGTLLNIDPNRIMTAGASVAQSMIGSNISQATGYSLGSNAFINTMMMQQRGQLSPTQLQNFGGAEGIAQITSSSQSAVLNSRYADIFLKAIYTKQVDSKGAGINKELVQKMISGDMSTREAQFRSQNITLSPQANMQYQFDKDSIISGLGDQATGFSYQIFEQLAKRNPFGDTLQGRAKFAMKMGFASDPQTARLFAQSQMTYNPMLSQVMEQQQQYQMLAGEDPMFSNKNNLLRGLNVGIERVMEYKTHLTRDSVFGYLNPTTAKGNRFLRNIANSITGGLSGEIMNFIDETGTPVQTETFQPFGKIKDSEDFYKTIMSMRGKETSTNKDLKDLGKMSLYSNWDRSIDPTDRDALMTIDDELKNDLLKPFYDKGMSAYQMDASERKSKYEYITDPAEQRKKVDDYVKTLMAKHPELQGEVIMNNGQKTDIINPIKGKVLQYMFGEENLDKTKNSLAKLDEGLTPKLQRNGRLINDDSFLGKTLEKTLDISLGVSKFWITNALDSNKNQKTAYNNFAEKFNVADIDTKKQMIEKLESIKDVGSESFTNANEQLLGNKSLSKDDISFILNDSKFKELRTAVYDPDSKDAEKRRNVEESIDTIFGSDAYKKYFKEFGNENLGSGLARGFLGLGNKDENLRITEEDFKKLKKSNMPGFTEMLKYAKFDNGEIDFDESKMSSTGYKKALGRFQSRYGGAITENTIMSASEVWGRNGASEVNTISSMAVAVAKGITMANTGDYSMKSWNSIKMNNDGNAEKEK